MKSLFVEKEICYTGAELAPHWIYKNFSLIGDSVVCFIGEGDVKLDHMVDLSDVIADSPIYSRKMMHFLVEHFNIELVEGVLRQRLLVNIAKEVILSYLADSEKIIRHGDDLFFNQGKLSVSIATKSVTSVLIHLGINIDSIGTPVKAAGLETDMGLKDFRRIADDIMNNYVQECAQIINASCKVRGVS